MADTLEWAPRVNLTLGWVKATTFILKVRKTRELCWGKGQCGKDQHSGLRSVYVGERSMTHLNTRPLMWWVCVCMWSGSLPAPPPHTPGETGRLFADWAERQRQHASTIGQGTNIHVSSWTLSCVETEAVITHFGWTAQDVLNSDMVLSTFCAVLLQRRSFSEVYTFMNATAVLHHRSQK